MNLQFKSSGKAALQWLLVFIAALLASLATTWVSSSVSLLNGLDDWRWRELSSGEGTSIYFIDIDEQSLSQYGRWPWPREQLALLIEKLLGTYQAGVVGVDIILAEPGDSQGNRLLASLDKERVVWAHAASIGDEPEVRQGVVAESPPCPAEAPWKIVEARGWLGLTPEIAGTDFRAGHIRPWPDSDGKVRTYQPFLANGDHCVPALGLAMYAGLLGIPPTARIEKVNSGWNWGGIPLGLEGSGQLRLIWRTESLRSVSAARIFNGEASIPAGAVTIVGSTALGIGDFVNTPVADRFTGAGIHALSLRQWLDQDFVVRPASHDLILALILTPLFISFWYFSSKTVFRPWIAWLTAFTLWLAASSLLWQRGILLEAEPFLWALLWLPGIQGLRLWQQHKDSRIIHKQFNAYLPENVLRELIDSRVDPHQLEAESREVSVLFADLRGFTSLSENLPPHQVVALLNEVMEYLSHQVAAYEGTLDKFIGDAVMAFWGAPVDMADHADRSVQCATAMLSGLDAFNRELAIKGMPPIDLTIGVNSGQVAVGHMGSLTRKNYTAIGDVVNVAARLQQCCGDLNQRLLVGESTANACQSAQLVKLHDIDIKGKCRPVTVFTAALGATSTNFDRPGLAGTPAADTSLAPTPRWSPE